MIKKNQEKIIENQNFIDSQIVKKDGKTVYYFIEEKDKDGNFIYHLTDDKNKATHYREILGTTIDGFCAVQDFYGNGQKQGEPFIERDIEFCNNMETNYNTNSLADIFYSDNGNISLIIELKNGKCYRFWYSDNKQIDQIQEIDTKQEKVTSYPSVNRNKTYSVLIYSLQNKQLQDFYGFWRNGVIEHDDFKNKNQIIWADNELKNLAGIAKLDEERIAEFNGQGISRTSNLNFCEKIHNNREQSLSKLK